MHLQLFPLTNAKVQRSERLNFYVCIKPLTVISKILGLMPYTIHVNRKSQIKKTSISVFNIIWFISCIMINLFLSYFVQKSSRAKANVASSVALFSDRFIWFAELFMYLSSIVLAMSNRNRFPTILQSIIDFDKEVKFEFSPNIR